MQDMEKKHLALLRSHLAECTVLLKTNGAFPLAGPCSIAAYGSGVRKTVKGGTGSGEVNSRYFFTVEQGLKNAGFTLTTTSWLDAYDAMYVQARKAWLKQLGVEAKTAKTNIITYAMGKTMPEPNYDLPLDAQGDAAIYVVSRISGEGNDRMPVEGDVKLSATEKRDILTLNKKFSKFMLVINAGGPVDLQDVQEVGNILVLSQLGVETGDALADILLGKQNPSGKLTTTWSAWEDYCNVGTFGDHNDTRYTEGIYVGYRYFDSVGKKALYPFGHGCSYTAFDVHAEHVALEGTQVTAQVRVTNTGAYAGKETVQIYVSAPEGKLDKPYQDLAAFGKTALLAPGQSETLHITFDLTSCASFDRDDAAYILEAGRYILRVGTSSTQTAVAAAIDLDRTVSVTQVRNCCGDPDFEDWRPEKRSPEALADDVPVLKLDASAVATRKVAYDHEYPIDDAVRDLSNEQLAFALVGAFDPKGGLQSFVGNASTTVAGAAGETTSQLKAQGFPNMVMADGPAGVRITPEYYRDEKGAHGIGSVGMPESMLEVMPGFVRWIMKRLSGSKPPQNAVIRQQYCTAIPIGTALAQSWNVDFAKICGHIVGTEMETYGIHLWLAPALNIHRSILCGRNFEYFSEDPLISGKMAAALTQGVQAHPGRGTTVKHYAANNQEYNRFGNNSCVSQRALREIYLKGFGICVRESQPKAVMTSYNLLNGRHTAESVDLCENILRREFGFQGIIMTDWVVGNGIMNSKEDLHPAVKPQLVAAAGGDLFMPGCKADYDNILKGLAEGSLTRQQLQINATRVYRMARMLDQQ
ncbi:MAG: beta-glucosidase-related glycosidase [Ruminococcaceae bacterium]|nr:beta-glucosidase-related glycosidase [Oscillospiraceae bacterium]